MTTYTGTIDVSGTLTDDYGDLYDISGAMLVTSRMTLLADGVIDTSTDYTGYTGALLLVTYKTDGTITRKAIQVGAAGVPDVTSLADFTVPLTTLSNWIGGGLTNTDSMSADHKTVTLSAAANIDATETLFPGDSPVAVTGTLTATGTLRAHWEDYQVFMFGGPLPTQPNGTIPYAFEITRQDTAAPDTILWSVVGAGSHPATAADFVGGVFPGGPVSFAAGQSSAWVTADVAGDAVIDQDQVFAVQVATVPGSFYLVAPQIGLGWTTSIAPNIGRIDLTAVQMTAYEGNTTPGTLSFAVNRSVYTADTATVDWSVVGFQANPATGADFQGGVLPKGTVTFAPGANRVVVTLTTQPDTLVAPDETFAVLISNPSASANIGVSAIPGIIANDDASVAIAAVQAAQAEDAGPAVFVLTRTGQIAAAASVAWSVAGSGFDPAQASDFTGAALPSGIASFAAGVAQTTIDIPVAADATVEPDEGYTVTLSSPISQNTAFDLSLGMASATATILNDDTAIASLAITATDAVKPEGNSGTTPFTFTVTRTGNTSSAVSVAWSATGAASSASANAQDFPGGVVPRGMLSFAAGQTSQAITVAVAGDTQVEPDEGFRVVLSAPSIGAVIATASAAATIRNDDTSFAIASTTGSHAEGNSGSTPFVFSVTRSGDVSGANSVAWTTAGMAPNSVGPADFLGGVVPSGTLSFAPGETSQTLTVAVAGDTLVEPDEYFRVALGAATGGASIAVASASAKIVNDDTSFAISATDADKPEGNSGSTPFVFTVTRSGNIAGTHSIGWLATGLSPNSVGPADFVAGTAFAGSLLFLPGQTTRTITVDIQGDTQVEPDEHFQVLLRNASAGAAIAVNHAEGTVINDDVPAGALTGYALDTGMMLLPVHT